MSEIILGNNIDKYTVSSITGELLMNGQTKLCPFRQDNIPCSTDCLHFNLNSDSMKNKFVLITCSGILVRIRLKGGA